MSRGDDAGRGAHDAHGPHGTLLVVATPIGNLDDVSPRVSDALRGADLVAAEDTRRTGRLLEHLGLEKPQVSCHMFNEARTLARLLDVLGEGRTVALVTDGGTPAVSDPGYRLVAAALEAGHRVSPVAGPSSVVAALSVAGLPADRFLFAGFLAARPAARRAELEALAAHAETLVLFEAPHRLKECLDDVAAILGERPATLCRELTKLHEEVRRGTTLALRDEIAARAEVLGEIVLVIAGRDPARSAGPHARDPELESAWHAALAREDGDARRALRVLARDLDVDRAALRRRLQAAGLVD